MKKIFTLLSVFLLMFLFSCDNQEKEFNFDDGVLVVGLEANYPPFNWLETTKTDENVALLDQDNAYVAGYDVEIAKLIAEELGLELQIRQVVWESLINDLKTNRIDLIIAGMSPTEERKEVINFSDNYYTVQHVVLAREGLNLSDSTDLNDLKGLKASGQTETVYVNIIDWLGENYGVDVKESISDIPTIVESLRTSVIDFTIVEKPVALGLVAANPSFEIAFDVEENIFNVSDEDRNISIGLRKVDTTLLEKVNEALATISNETRTNLMNQAIENSPQD